MTSVGHETLLAQGVQNESYAPLHPAPSSAVNCDSLKATLIERKRAVALALLGIAVFVSIIVAVAAASGGEDDKSQKNALPSDVGGVWEDPKHFQEGTLRGVRMISDYDGSTPSTELTVVGSDDGASFWTLLGYFTDTDKTRLTVDFSPKGGPNHLTATFHATRGVIAWSDGNNWTKSSRDVGICYD